MWMLQIIGNTSMLYLYLKTHNKTGLKYLGYTSKNPFKYKGSGLHWKRHLKIHGNDISTEILKECVDKNEIKYWGEYFSNLWNIVDNTEWANLKPESGDGGSNKGCHIGFKHSDETKKIISDKKKGKPNPASSYPRTAEQKLNLSIKLKGKKRSTESLEKSKITRAENPFTHSEETKQKMRKPKSAQHKENMIAADNERNTGAMWINNGEVSKTIKDNILPDGWVKGKLVKPTPPSQKGKFWITNGIENKMVREMLPGFTKGRS
jgi:hypothetical protein